MSMRLVQLENSGARHVALVEEPRLRLLSEFATVQQLAAGAMAQGVKFTDFVSNRAESRTLDYDAIYRGHSDWKLLSPIDHPHESSRCLVSGTGLTHLGSARDRQAMHAASEKETDSMKMFRWGVEAGRPEAGHIGIAPEWFYKGAGSILRAHGQPLDVPAYAEDGGEEAEIAGIYLVGADGVPARIGMAIGNEFSDHVFEKKNYLNLAGSKMRTCSLGPELVVAADFSSVSGEVVIERNGEKLWSKPIRTGEAEMSHSLANIEHHHFKFEPHRRPGDVHVHYYGACALSFGEGIKLMDGDVMSIAFENFGRALRNPLRILQSSARLVQALPLA